MTGGRHPVRWFAGMLLLLAVMLGAPGVAQAAWTEQTSKLPGVIVYGTSCPTSTQCMQTTNAGEVQTTTDAGTLWTLRTAIPDSSIRGLSCPTTTVCFATAIGGEIYKTTNFGGAWTPSFNGSGALYGIDCPTDQICYAVGAGGMVRTTVNGGTAWDVLDSGAALLYGIACPTTTVCYAYTSAGDIYRKNAANNTWVLSLAGPAMHATAYGVSCPSVNVCYAAGTAGVINKTVNGTSWTPQTTSSTPDIYAMSCASETRCLAVGVAQQASYTDNGSTWTETANTGSGGAMYSIDWAGSSLAFSGSTSGTFVYDVPLPPDASLAVTETLTPGTLSFIDGTPGNVTFPSTPLSNTSQTVTAAQPLIVADASGSGNGWSISATSTTFTTGSRTLPNDATTVSAQPSIACKASTTCTPATNLVSYPFSLPAGGTAPTARKLFSADVDTGLGAQRITPTWRLVIPPTAYTGTYTSTWTFTLMSGP